MADLQAGFVYSGTSPNNSVTASNLNSVVGAASILPAFISNKPLVNSLADADMLLLLQASSGTLQRVSATNAIPTGKSSRMVRNLVAKNNSGTPTTQIDITADEILLRTATSGVYHLSGLSVTLDITVYTAGPTVNGRDFATLTAETWYYFYAISDGSNIGALLSASATSPTLPTSYTYYTLLGAVRYDRTSVLTKFLQRDNDVWIQMASNAGSSDSSSKNSNPFTGATPAEFNNVSLDTLGGGTTTFQSADLSRCIPPNLVAKLRGIIGATSGTTNVYTVASFCAGTQTTATTFVGGQIFPVTFTAACLGFRQCSPFEVGIYTSQTIYWAVDAGGTRHNMRITGFTLNL